MTNLQTIEFGGKERRLGCLPCDSLDLTRKTYFDRLGASRQVYSLDEIRTTLAGKKSMHLRRDTYAGTTFVRDQHQFGACNGWSTAGGLSCLRLFRGEPYVCLSGADAYSQMNGGRDNGSILQDGMDKVFPTGIAPESLVPYNKIYASQIGQAARDSRIRFSGSEALPLDDEQALANAVLAGDFVVVAVHADNNFFQEDGDGVNLMGNGTGNHSVLVQDIRVQSDGTLNFDMRNSWNTGFCQGGYTWLTWNRHFRETVKYHRFWAMVSTRDDTKDDSEPPVIKTTAKKKK